DRLAAVRRLGVDDRRHSVIGREGEEFRLELIARADIHGMDAVVEARFLEKHRDLVAVRRRPIIKFDHRLALFSLPLWTSSSARTGRSNPSSSSRSGRLLASTRIPISTPRRSRARSCAGWEALIVPSRWPA